MTQNVKAFDIELVTAVDKRCRELETVDFKYEATIVNEHTVELYRVDRWFPDMVYCTWREAVLNNKLYVGMDERQ